MRLRLALVSFLVLPMAAQAQQSDTQQILQLLQGMNGRLDTIEKRLDKVEKVESDGVQPATQATAPVAPASPVPPADGAGSTPAAASSQPPPGVAVPGWKIDVFPYEKDGVAAAPIARTRAPTGKTSFSLHFGGGPVSSPVTYKGKGYFWAKQPGTYTFSVYVDQSKAENRFDCEAQLAAEGSSVVGYFSNSAPVAHSGSVELQEGKYLIDYAIGCWPREQDGKTYEMDAYYIKLYQNISYTISVLGPDDSSLRDFDRDELFIVLPPDRAKKKQSMLEPAAQPAAYAEDDQGSTGAFAAVTAPAAPAAIPMTGAGVTTGPTNFRTGPSKSAPTAYMLPEGTPLTMIAQFDRWYRVQVRNGDIGFVHASLVAPLLHD